MSYTPSPTAGPDGAELPSAYRTTGKDHAAPAPAESTDPWGSVPNRHLRWATHALTLGLVVAVVAANYPSTLGLPSHPPMPTPRTVQRDIRAPAGDLAEGLPLGNDATEAEGTPILTPGSTDVPFQALARTPGYFIKVPQRTTIIPKRPRKELVTYTVQAGDNLSTIAERFDVDTDTLIWANGQELEADPDYIVVGQKLIIPPVPGVLHTVKAGDTVESVAKLYKADPHAIIDSDFNKLSPPYTLTPGTTIMVPGGEKAYQPRVVYINGVAVMVNAPRGGGKFIWPTQGIITTFYTPDHRAIDIANAMGTPVYASSSGVVIFAGWYGTYGNTVIIDHGDGFQSLYAHLAVYYPSPGMNVRRGQAIGKMGSTGKSTGPHLHFEIHYAGGVVNPFKYLPQQ